MVVEVILTSSYKREATAKVERIFKTTDKAVSENDEIIIKFSETSCGPWHRVGDKGVISGKIAADIDDRPVLCFDEYVSDCTPGAIKNAKETKRKAEKGNAKAQAELGALYEHGYHARHDNAEAIKWYTLAAKNGNIKAMLTLADAYAYGILGVKRNEAEAVNWLNRAAKKRDKDSQPKLKALEEYIASTNAAKSNDAEAQYRLGVIYYDRNYNMRLTDDNRKENIAEAIKWLKLAAAQGHAKAMQKLGHI